MKSWCRFWYFRRYLTTSIANTSAAADTTTTRLWAFLCRSITAAAAAAVIRNILSIKVRIVSIDRTFSWTFIVDHNTSLFFFATVEFCLILLAVEVFIPI